MASRIAITGIGCISPLGLSVADFSQKLFSGSSAISAAADEAEFRYPSARITEFDPAAHFDTHTLPLLDPFSAYAVVAAREAAENAGLDHQLLRQAAAIIGTGCGGKQTDEETYQKLYLEQRKRVHPLTIPRGMPSAAASQVSIQLGIQGPAFSVTSACSSSAHAIAQAALLIRAGLVELAICGGTDAPFTYGLLKSWEALRVLSKDTCRPFSKDRSGLVLGEGAAMLVLESETHARRRGANTLAFLQGIGMSSDASHITDPSPQGAAAAMSSAITDAGINAADIDYINAHGTATQANDISETQAIHAVFGAHAQRLGVSSSKSMHGHSLGAAGAMEAVASVLAMQQGRMSPTANFTSPGEGCDLDYIANTARNAEIRYVLSNSFAFGGLNAVLLFAHA